MTPSTNGRRPPDYRLAPPVPVDTGRPSDPIADARGGKNVEIGQLPPPLPPDPPVSPPPPLPPLPTAKWGGYVSVFGTRSGEYPNYAAMRIINNGAPLENSVTFNFDGNRMSQDVTVATAMYNHVGGRYSYVAWDTWSGGARTYTRSSDNKTFGHLSGHFVYGQLSTDVPTSGRATYKGELLGDLIRSRDLSIARGGVQGEVAFDVNLASSQVGGWLSFYKVGEAQEPWLVASLNNVAISRTTSRTEFRGGLNAGPGTGGGIYGAFFGPGGAEMGGTYWLDADDDSAGAFRAKPTSSMPTAPAVTRPPVVIVPPPPVVPQGPQVQFVPDHGGDIAGTFPGGNSLFTSSVGVVQGSGSSDPLSYGTKTVCCGPSGSTIAVKVDAASFRGDSGKASDVYQYTAWGEWSSAEYTPGSSGTMAERGYFLLGRATRQDEMPKVGTATYAGDVRAIAFGNEKITGRSQFTADFGQNKIDGNLALNRADGSQWVNLSATGMAINGTSFGSSTAKVTTPAGAPMNGAAGNMFRRFYGTAAQEVGGNFALWGVTSGPAGADGIFRAKK